MLEQTRSSREQTIGPGGLGSIFDEPEVLPGQITVTSGPYAEALPLAGLTVGHIRQRYQTHLDIAAGAQAVVNGRDVGEDIVLQQGQVLAFMHRAGEKGSGTRSADGPRPQCRRRPTGVSPLPALLANQAAASRDGSRAVGSAAPLLRAA